MHEEAMLRDVRRKLEALAEDPQIGCIRRATIWIGALAHVNADGIRRRWPETVRGTAAEGAELEVEVSEDLGDPRASGIALLRVAVEPTAGFVGAEAEPKAARTEEASREVERGQRCA